MTTTFFLTAMLLIFGLPAVSGDPPKSTPADSDPNVVMKSVLGAIKKFETISYTVNYKANGWIADFVPTIKATVLMAHDAPNKAARFRATLSILEKDAKEPVEIEAGADGEVFYLVDKKTKTLHADIDSAVLGRNGWNIFIAKINELSDPKTFEDDIHSVEMTRLDDKTVAGVECLGLRFKPKNGAKTDWYVSKKDFLPRLILHTYPGDPKQGDATDETTLTELVVNPKTPDKPFALIVPEGFKKTDDFAP